MEKFWIIFGIVCALYLIRRICKSKWARGKIGEHRVKRVLGKTKENCQYVIHDLRIRAEDEKTCQIDHILINPNGIFVIETKNLSGRIYGKEKQIEWVQSLNFGKTKHTFYNPVRQNNTHCHFVNRVLEGQYPIASAVVFVQGNIAFIKSPDVYSLRGLRKILREPIDSDGLSYEEMKDAYCALLEADCNVSMREHARNIKKLKKSINRNVCPRCGAPLVLKRSHYGDFLGCSAYPNCRFYKRLEIR